MRLPKYTYHIGRAIEFAMSYRSVDITGDYGFAPNTIASNKIKVNCAEVYLVYNVKADETVNLHFYNNEKYISKHQIIKSGFIELPEHTDSLIIELKSESAHTQKLYKEFVKNGYSDLYELSKVNPHYKKLSKKYSKERGNMFFRTSLEGQMSLFGDDFNIIYRANLNSKFVFLIKKLSTLTNTWLEYYRGTFTKTDCKVDVKKRKCEIKPEALDAYSNIMNCYDNVYDLIKLSPEITRISMCKRAVTQVYIRGTNTISNFFSGTYWEDDVIEAVENHDSLINKYHFAYLKTGNELYVNGAKVPGVDGVYAGIEGEWNGNKGFTCYVDKEHGVGGNYVYIKRDIDDSIVYKSKDKVLLGNIDEQDYFLDADEKLEMVNIHDTSDAFTIEKPFVYHIYQRLLCDVNFAEDASGIKETYDIPVDDFVSDNKNYKKCIGLKCGNFFCTARAINEPTKYGLNDYGEYFTNKFLPKGDGIGRSLPICRNTWANASLWYAYNENLYSAFEKSLRKKYELKDSYSIAAVIKALLSKIDPTIQHEATSEYSKFLYDTHNPMFSDRFYVYITQKTNLLKSQYDQAAQKAEITFADVMNMLRDCFRCYWFIDGNKLKIEHVSYFMNGGSYDRTNASQLDFTKLVDMFNKKNVDYFQSEIEFNKDELIKRYEFNWMDDVTELFGQVTIDVNANYVQQDKKEDISISKFSSDVDLMLINPANFSNDGFALLCPVRKSAYYELPIINAQLVDENDESYSLLSQNWYASWAYLISYFYMHDLPAYKVDVNVLQNAYVKRIKMSLKHTIEFPSEEDLDELKLITTSIGRGKIDSYSINLNTRMAKVDLMYEPS